MSPVKLDTITYGHPLRDIGEVVRNAEARGYDAWLTSEVQYDPFLPCAVAAVATDRIQLGTAITVAFARNPMTVAQSAHNIQQALGDRPFLLGLGSQIKPHITKRFSQDWPDRPAAAMREFVQALHAIWSCWNDGEELAFRGEYYTHSIMTPMFTPPPNTVTPKVWLAAVGTGMTRVAGEVADGILCHGFTTATYFTETTLPAVEEGISRVEGRTREDVEVVLPPFVITGYTDEQRAGARQAVLQQIGFYGSTPAYRPVLEAHGWGELGEELHRLSRSDGWGRMPAIIDEEVVDAFAIVADPDVLGEAIVERFGGAADRIQLGEAYGLSDAHLDHAREVLADA